MENVYYDPGAKVAEGIFIGSLSTALSEKCLSDMNIDVIINLSGHDYESKRPVANIYMHDTDVLTSTMEDYLQKFASGVQKIYAARLLEQNVLVHCAAGVNRSATLIAFYLIEIGHSYKDIVAALEAANETRGVPVLTNGTFRYLLQARESFKRNFSTTNFFGPGPSNSS